MNPCPLCLFQRLALLGTAAGWLLGALWGPRHGGRWVSLGVTLGSAMAGLGVALRHLWIQSLPADPVPSCGPGLAYMWANFPLSRMLQLVLTGSGECAKVERWWGLPLPAWSLMVFLGMAAAAIWWCVRRPSTDRA